MNEGEDLRERGILQVGRLARIYLCLRVSPGEWKSIPQIAKETGLSKKTVRNALGKLANLPRIERRKREGKVQVRFRRLLPPGE
ncbi:hypothetical protein AKJ40_02145 [candidate division MSBL1 archaeon SCGC-AAA259M10]|uniref:HTH marR-type domain-containing protein n=2 Tax=candidate division MSBL1 TaxID=215777 RepID=A0A133U5Q9_9EURY|nr:hypothetical protein AKJ62_02945 [candidate division MSBL1 archaeon SCGC-AAA259D14]KXA99975.1 hypothetical protein AKJ40_02145 [candidate division MSBL1 archaeon SCGC-AAA259M10]